MNSSAELTNHYRAFLNRFLRDKHITSVLSVGHSQFLAQVSNVSYVEIGYPSMAVSFPFPKVECAIVCGLLEHLNSNDISVVVRKLADVRYVIWVVELDGDKPRWVPNEVAGYFRQCQTILTFAEDCTQRPVSVLLADSEEMRVKDYRSLLQEYTARVKEYPDLELGGDQRPNSVPYAVEKQVGSARFSFLIANEQGRAWYDTTSDAKHVQVDVRTDIDFIRDNLIQPGATIFDVGAHHGLYSLCFARAVDKFGRVVAFEPLPHCADIVRYNARLNRISNLEVKELALKAEPGALRMFSPMLSPMFNDQQYEDGFDVPADALDSYVHERPSLLKINCGGYEVPVLRGAKKLLELTPNLALRVYPDGLKRHGNTVDELLNLVAWQNYTCWYTDGAGVIKPWHRALGATHETTIFAKSLLSTCKVVMLYDEQRSSIGSIAAENVARYCERHGYQLVKHTRLLDPKLNGSWNKLKAVRQALEGSDWVLWVDCDALIVDPQYPLASLVTDYCKEKPFGVSVDYNGICMGLFIIRNCAWSVSLLDSLIYLGEGHADKMSRYDAHNRWEQNTMKCLMDFFPTVAEGVAQIPETVIQNPKSVFNKNAFIMHYWAGSSGNPELVRQKMEHCARDGWTELTM